MSGVWKYGAMAALVALLSGCGGGSPAAVVPAPEDTSEIAVQVSDAPTSTADPDLAPIVVQPSGAFANETQPAADPSLAVAQDVAAEVIQPDEPAMVDEIAPVDEGAGEIAPAAPAAEVAGGTSARPPDPGLETPDGISLLIEGGTNGRKEVAFTFDAGADRGFADAILDLLRDEGIVSTFGMTGTWAEANPDLIQRMVAEGHQLINHTWTHDSLTGANTGKPAMTFEQLADELASTEQIVRDLTGYELKPYFRPPYGDYDATTLTWLNDLGYPYTIMWTCDTRGWAGWDAVKIVDYCTSVPLEDDIILMHVGASAAGDYEALPGLIDYYRTNGYAFVTAEQMLQP